MEQAPQYEGFSNEKTWYIALRIENDRKSYEMMRDRIPFTAKSVQQFVRWIHTLRVFDAPDKLKLFPDIGRFSNRGHRWFHFGGVNWKELAEHFNANAD